MTDDWLSNGLPVFFGGSNKNEARSLLSRIGGPSGFKTAKTTLPDGSVMTVQTKGTMPPQISISRVTVSAAGPVGPVWKYVGEEYMGFFADHSAYSFTEGWYRGTTTVSAKALSVNSGVVVGAVTIDSYTRNNDYHRDRRWVTSSGDVYTTHSSGTWPYMPTCCHSLRVSDLPWYQDSGAPKAVKEGDPNPYLLWRYSPQSGASPVITATCADAQQHTVLLSYNISSSVGGVDISTGDEVVVWDHGSASKYISPHSWRSTAAPTVSGLHMAAIGFQEVTNGTGDDVPKVYAVNSATGDYSCLAAPTATSHSTVTINGFMKSYSYVNEEGKTVTVPYPACQVSCSSEETSSTPIGAVIQGENILPLVLNTTASASGSFESGFDGDDRSYVSEGQVTSTWSVDCGGMTVCSSSSTTSEACAASVTSGSSREHCTLYAFYMPESGVVAVVAVKKQWPAFPSLPCPRAPQISVELHIADVWNSRSYSYAFPSRGFTVDDGYYDTSNGNITLPTGGFNPLYKSADPSASASRTIQTVLENGVTTVTDSAPADYKKHPYVEGSGVAASDAVSIYIEDLGIHPAIGTRDRPFGAVFGDEHVALISMRSPLSNTEYINVSIDRDTGGAHAFDYGTWYQLFYIAQVQT